MPGLDGTGPAGQGPMTSGARGTCVTDNDGRVVRTRSGAVGRGRGRGGVGRGLGFGSGAGQAVSAWGRGAGRRWSR